jgi:hypothetical protein
VIGKEPRLSKIFCNASQNFPKETVKGKTKKGQSHHGQRRSHHHGHSIFARPSLACTRGSLIQGDMARTYGRPQQETKTNNMKSMLRFLGLPSVKTSLR